MEPRSEIVGRTLGPLIVIVAMLASCGTEEAEPEILGMNEDLGAQTSSDAGALVDLGPDQSNDTPDASRPADDASTAPPDVATNSPDSPTDVSGPAIIFLAPDGDDARDGASEQAAIKTVARAQELVTLHEGRDVEVRVGMGTYYGQKVVWEETRENHTITFTRWPLDGPGRPAFDGCDGPDGPCPGGTWFMLKHSAGEETNLVFNYLRVENYGTAISLNGARNAESTSNGSNRIFGCYFANIGNVFNPALNPSTAAVRLVNSDDNEIANNHFINVVNTTSGGLIHAIYVAHMSDRNTIRANRFKVSTGDPVRVRDFSNDNVIVDNSFIQVGTRAGYTDWYCDHDARNDCTKVGPECPSWGNSFRDNLLDGKYDCTPLGTFHYFQDETTTGCAPPSPDARRLRTSGNSQNSPPCSSE